MFLPSNITLKFGDTGDFVSELQRRLVAVGTHADGNVTGFFDGTTVNSVSSFQSRSGLRADGIAGPETLRKLNGVMSGDTSSGSSGNNQEEEEAKKLAADNVLRNAMLDLQAAQQLPVEIATHPEAEIAHAREAYQPTPEPVHPEIQHAHVPVAADPQLTLQQQIQRETQAHQQSPQASAHEQLTQLLLQQTGQPPRAPEPTQAAPAASPQHVPQQHTPAQAAQAHQAELPREIPKAPAAAAQPQPQPQHTAQPVPAAAPAHETAPEPQKGLIGRAMQKIDGALQKLSDYFEKKLAPDTLSEVKQLGAVMLQSGVKQAAMPDGPEQTRAPSAPALPGRETQTQAAHRG